jgi:hypothetical protein
MTEIPLALQIAARTRLVTAPSVTDLVPAAQIFDGLARPEKFPCIIIGECLTIVEPITFARSHVRTTFDLHVWTKGAGLEATKILAGNVRQALKQRPAIDGLHVVDWQVTTTRFLRDPAEIGHAIITVEALVQELGE